MKMSAAGVIVTRPGCNFVTLKIETDQGLYGIGGATLNGRELSVVAYLEDHVIPAIAGGPAADRGHLAVPLPRCLLAARPGDDARDCRGRCVLRRSARARRRYR
jgi:L-alanine-DL-glutamate epimerase-like enolase superfamily enzyme